MTAIDIYEGDRKSENGRGSFPRKRRVKIDIINACVGVYVSVCKCVCG